MKPHELALILEVYDRMPPRTRLFVLHALRHNTPPAARMLVEQDTTADVPDLLDACRRAGVDL